MSISEELQKIESQITEKTVHLDLLHKERQYARTVMNEVEGLDASLAALGLKRNKYTLVAQGDSWFDYPPHHDLIDWLRDGYGHKIHDVAVAGSTLDEIAYGLLPRYWLGIPQSDVSRMVELISMITEIKPHALLLSAGGNDIAGPEFFTFIDNARSSLQSPNPDVLKGVINKTFLDAYKYIINMVTAKAQSMGLTLPIFVHGYDYPWPDGRGVTAFNLVGPWFDGSFKKKNYPYDPDSQNADQQLKNRYDIVHAFIDSFNEMLISLQTQYPGVVYYINLRGTLKEHKYWGNELHPTREGFGMLAEVMNKRLHEVLG